MKDIQKAKFVFYYKSFPLALKDSSYIFRNILYFYTSESDDLRLSDMVNETF